jgi:hypothetical protein
MTPPVPSQPGTLDQKARAAAIKAVCEIPVHGGGYIALYQETLRQKLTESLCARIVDAAIRAYISAAPPPPEGETTPEDDLELRAILGEQT